MVFASRSPFEWKLRTRSLSLGRRTLVMGVLNTTPDSFSDGGRLDGPSTAIETALQMLEAGASILDIGGESSHPGKRAAVSAEEEMDRVLPVITGVLRRAPEAVISVDTYKAATAEAALKAGVEIINDISGFMWDEALPALCARSRCGVVLMHTRGHPADWRYLPPLLPTEVVPLVQTGLAESLLKASSAGVSREHIVLDPGFGFGKSFAENYPLLAGLGELRSLGQPILAGLSRKSFLGRTLAPLYEGKDAPVEMRENASLAGAVAAILAGAHVVRVHNVRAAMEAAAITDAVLNAAGSS